MPWPPCVCELRGETVVARLLEAGRRALAARDPYDHAPEFPQQPLPRRYADVLALQGFSKDVVQAQFPVCRQFNRAPEGVQGPTEDHLGGGPAGVPLEQLAFGDGLLVDCWIVVRVVGTEDPVVDVEGLAFETV